MSEWQSNSTTWESVISDFMLQKSNSDEEKYIKESIKVFENSCMKSSYYESETLRNYLEDNKPTKAKEESSIEFQRRRLKELLDIKNDISIQDELAALEEVRLIEDQCNKKVLELGKKYDSITWISEASNNAASVSFATHVSILTVKERIK